MIKGKVGEWLSTRLAVRPVITLDDKGLLCGRYDVMIRDLTLDEVNLLLVTFQTAKEAQSVTPRKRVKK